MLEDFNFKILHRPRFRHTNVDALSRNPMGPAMVMMISVKKSRTLEVYKLIRMGGEYEILFV
jgi:hypothetical protein